MYDTCLAEKVYNWDSEFSGFLGLNYQESERIVYALLDERGAHLVGNNLVIW